MSENDLLIRTLEERADRGVQRGAAAVFDAAQTAAPSMEQSRQRKTPARLRALVALATVVVIALTVALVVRRQHDNAAQLRTANPVSADALAGQIFEIRSLEKDGVEQVFDLARPAVRFEASTFVLNNGMTFLTGSYAISAGQLIVSALTSLPGGVYATPDTPSLAQREVVDELVASTPRVSLEGDTLTLTAGDIVAIARRDITGSAVPTQLPTRDPPPLQPPLHWSFGWLPDAGGPARYATGQQVSGPGHAEYTQNGGSTNVIYTTDHRIDLTGALSLATCAVKSSSVVAPDEVRYTCASDPGLVTKGVVLVRPWPEGYERLEITVAIGDEAQADRTIDSLTGG